MSTALERARAAARRAQESLYEGVCDIIEYQKYTKPNGATASHEVTVYEAVPCRVSYGYLGNRNAANGDWVAVAIEQTIKLFINPDITIKAGSKNHCNPMQGNDCIL